MTIVNIKKTDLKNNLLIVASCVALFLVSCEDDEEGSTCDIVEICEDNTTNLCCNDDQVCTYTFNGKDYSDDEYDDLVDDIACSAGSEAAISDKLLKAANRIKNAL